MYLLEAGGGSTFQGCTWNQGYPQKGPGIHPHEGTWDQGDTSPIFLLMKSQLIHLYWVCSYFSKSVVGKNQDLMQMRLLHIHDLIDCGEFQPIRMLIGACRGVLIEVHVEVYRGHKEVCIGYIGAHQSVYSLM